jgi:hypothetical protein
VFGNKAPVRGKKKKGKRKGEAEHDIFLPIPIVYGSVRSVQFL